MKFLDHWVSRSFGKDATGATVFYPRNKEGASYFVRTPAERAKIEIGLKTHYARFLIFLVGAFIVGQFNAFHTLSRFSTFLQTVLLVGAAALWSHQNFLKDTAATLPVAHEPLKAKDYRPQIIGVIVLLVLVAFVIIMSSRLPQGNLPPAGSAPVAVPGQ